MKLRRLAYGFSTFVLSASSLFVLASPSVHAAGGYTCTWTNTSGDEKFSTDANWAGCNGAAPVAGDADLLVFNNSLPAYSPPLNSDDMPNNDLTGATFASISFMGMGTKNVNITGNSFTLTGGFDDTVTGQNTGFSITAPITISGNQAFTIAATDSLTIYGSISGSGNINVTAGTGGLLDLVGDNSTYTGTLTMNSGYLKVDDSNSLAGTGGTVVNNGASIGFFTDACAPSATKTFNLSNLTLSGAKAIGTGSYGPDVKFSTATNNCLGPLAYGEVYGFRPNDRIYTIDGTINLGSDVSFGSLGISTTLTGTLSGNYNITLDDGYPSALIINSQTNTSKTTAGKHTSQAILATISDSKPAVTVYMGGNVDITLNGARGSTTLAAGATINGSGTVAGLSAGKGSTVAPGHSPGCLNISGNLTFGGTYQAQIGGTTACTQYDQMIVSAGSTVTLNDGGTPATQGTLQLSLVNGFVPKVGDSFTIINNQGAQPVSDTFTGLAEGATVVSDGVTYTISYKGGDGNDVVLTVTKVDAAAAAAASPKAPDTGFNHIANNPLISLVITFMAVAGLSLIARKQLGKK